MTAFYNRTSEKEKRKALRREMRPAELRLWGKLRNDQVGVTFRRQYSVGPYILDFYCPAAKLAVEIDGSIHQVGDNPQYDAERQDYIEHFGIRFVRFSND